MNRDIVQGNWKRLKGKTHERWAMLTGDHLGVVTGRRMQLVGDRQWAYGIFRQTASTTDSTVSRSSRDVKKNKQEKTALHTWEGEGGKPSSISPLS